MVELFKTYKLLFLSIITLITTFCCTTANAANCSCNSVIDSIEKFEQNIMDRKEADKKWADYVGKLGFGFWYDKKNDIYSAAIAKDLRADGAKGLYGPWLYIIYNHVHKKWYCQVQIGGGGKPVVKSQEELTKVQADECLKNICEWKPTTNLLLSQQLGNANWEDYCDDVNPQVTELTVARVYYIEDGIKKNLVEVKKQQDSGTYTINTRLLSIIDGKLAAGDGMNEGTLVVPDAYVTISDIRNSNSNRFSMELKSGTECANTETNVLYSSAGVRCNLGAPTNYKDLLTWLVIEGEGAKGSAQGVIRSVQARVFDRVVYTTVGPMCYVGQRVASPGLPPYQINESKEGSVCETLTSEDIFVCVDSAGGCESN